VLVTQVGVPPAEGGLMLVRLAANCFFFPFLLLHRSRSAGGSTLAVTQLHAACVSVQCCLVVVGPCSALDNYIH
jgi:hypothetical protein